MKYKLEVKDTNNWINTILETNNGDDFLVLEIDLRPKRLSYLQHSFSKGFGVTLFKTEETLNANEEGFSEINISPEGHEFKRMITTGSKYSITIVVFDTFVDNKIVYIK